jgi:hypothetical protein
MRDRVQDRINRVASSMRSGATSEPATPEPKVESSPVKRLCRKCGCYFDGALCTACEFIKFMKDEPVAHESGWPCAICGTSESDKWHSDHDNFKIRMQTVTRPMCHTCFVMRAQDKTPVRDVEEMWLDFRVAQELGVAGPWLERGAEGWVNRAHGLTRLFLKVTDEQRPMIAAELNGYVNHLDEEKAGRVAKSRRPLWWLKLNKTMAEAYFADYGKIKVHESASGPESTYIHRYGFVGGDPYFFTGHKPGTTQELGW